MRGSPEKTDTGQTPVISDGDRKMIEQVSQPDHRPRLRSRFLSISKSRRPQRRSRSKLSQEGRILVDDFYSKPAKLLLDDIGQWDFNVFTFDTLSGGRSVFHIAYHLFQTYDLIRSFRLDTVCLLHFLSLVEANYHESNPYHNAVHAADVTQSMHCFLQETEIRNATSDIEKMVALVAALTHDLDHPGVNNAFLIVTANHLATLYENISVLENHHFRCAVGLLQESGLLNHFSQHERTEFYRQLKELILATDITRQPEFLQKFCRCIESGEFDYRTNKDDRFIMLQIALKCADISNPCREWKVSQRWSRRVCNEFFLQGDTERSLQIPVLPLCDREGNTVANIQNGFMQFVAQPLFKAWHQFMQTPLTAKMLDHLASNQTSWQAIMSGVGVRKKSSKIIVGDDARENVDDDDDNDSCDSDVDYEFLEEEEGEEDLEHVGEERMDVVDAAKEEQEVEEEPMDIKSALSDEVPGVKTVTLVLPPEVSEEEEEVEEENKGEAADVVHNDVNLLYQYQSEPDESSGSLGPVGSAPRCLSPVSERAEMGSNEITADLDPLQVPSLNTSLNGRRFSVPAIVPVRKDLSFYLGLRRDSAGPSPSSSTASFASSTNLCSYSSFSRRQSLPTTALYFHGSNQAASGGTADVSSVSPRSLSVDALLARPKITSLSPGGFGEVGNSGKGFPNMTNVYGNSISNFRGEGDSSCSSTPSQSDQVSLCTGAKDICGLPPLFNQTLLMLQGSDMTRFTSNPNLRRASYDPGLAQHTRQGTNCPRVNKDTDASGYGYSGVRRLTLPVALTPSPSGTHLQKEHIQDRRHRKYQQNQDNKQSLHPPSVGLAASWPSLNSRRKTTNGTTPKKLPESIDHKQAVRGHNHIIDTSTLPSHVQASSGSFGSPSSMNSYPNNRYDDRLNRGLSHQELPDGEVTAHLSSKSFQSAVSAPSSSHLSQPITVSEVVDQTEGRQRTNPHCLSLTSSHSSSAQENNHPPRPQ